MITQQKYFFLAWNQEDIFVGHWNVPENSHFMTIKTAIIIIGLWYIALCSYYSSRFIQADITPFICLLIKERFRPYIHLVRCSRPPVGYDSLNFFGSQVYPKFLTNTPTPTHKFLIGEIRIFINQFLRSHALDETPVKFLKMISIL